MYVSPNLSQQIQNRKIELHAELKLCTFIRFKCVLCNLLAVSATLLHFARYSDSGETCSHAPAQHCHAETITGKEWQNVAAGAGSLSSYFLFWLSVPSGARATGGSASKIISTHADQVPPPQYIAVAPKAQILF